MFLYSINCVFICISTFIIVKYLKYPAKKDVDELHQRRVKYGLTAIIILMLLPSAYFAFLLYKKQEFLHKVDAFIEKEFIEKGNTIVYKKTRYSTLVSNIEVAFLNKSYSENELIMLNEALEKYGLANTTITIMKNSMDNLTLLKNDILNEVSKKEVVMNEKDKEIERLKKIISKNTFDNQQIFEETKAIFPTIQTISIANHSVVSNDTILIIPVLIYNSNPKLTAIEKSKLKKWLKKRESLSNLEIVEQ